MKTLSAKLANVVENAARGAIPEARFGREFAPSPSKDGTARTIKRLEVYALGGVITAMPATITIDAGDCREQYVAVRFEATARNGERRRWDASPDMTGTVINAAKRHLAEGRIPTPESKTANQ